MDKELASLKKYCLFCAPNHIFVHIEVIISFSNNLCKLTFCSSMQINDLIFFICSNHHVLTPNCVKSVKQ